MEEDDEGGSGAAPLDEVKSYLGYALLALKRHKRIAGIVVATGLVATTVVVSVWPRSYECVTLLGVHENRILDGDRLDESLRGAEEIVLNHQNVARLVDQIDLTHRWDQTLPPARRLKQTVMQWVRGPMSEAGKRDALIAMTTSAITVVPPGWNQHKLGVNATWHDPKIASDLAGAALQSFIKARETAEVASISEYIGILEGHANELRDEIQKLSNESQKAREERLSELQKGASAPRRSSEPAPVAARAAAPHSPAPRPVEDLSELRATLAQKEATLKQMEDDRQRRLVEAQAALTSLRAKFTPAHPFVVTAERNIASLSQDTAGIATLRAEAASLASTLKSKSAAEDLVARGGPRVASVPNSSGTPGAPGIEPLPAEIMRLMQEDSEELDPTVAAQFRGAVAKFAMLRDKIGTARVDLDTAQAAFKRRYQIVIPPEPPGKPSAPKLPLFIAVGVLGSVALAWLLAIIAELRVGRVVERWQVYRLGVPVIGELRWPPTSDT